MARDRDDDRDDDKDDRDERPSRRRQDDDDDTPAKGGMDGFLGNIAVAIIFGILSLCCPLLGLILGGIGLGTCKTPDGKRGSMIVLICGVVGIVVNIVSVVVQMGNR